MKTEGKALFLLVMVLVAILFFTVRDLQRRVEFLEDVAQINLELIQDITVILGGDRT